MIPKGNQRGGGRQLATHLLNEYDNDRVEVLDMRGSVADDLHGAFSEWQAQSRATRCQKYLYSLSINPDHRQQDIERRHYFDYIERVEQRMGLAGQPRAVVMHVKNGREHCHVVWSRIDAEHGRAVQMSYDRQTLRAITQEYARDYGLDLPDGAKKDRGKDRFDEKRKRENQAEKGQQKRTGISKEERCETVTAAWRESDSGKGFVRALAERGYHVAQGDKKDAKRSRYLVVDMFGEVHSLSRQLRGVKVPDLRERLGDYNALPSIDVARESARQQLEARQQEKKSVEADAATRSLEFTRQQAERRADVEAKRETLTQRHETERAALAALLHSERGRTAAQAVRTPGRFSLFLQRITGIQKYVASRQQKQEATQEAWHAEHQKALDRRQDHERRDIERQHRDLAAIEKRERASFADDQRRGTLPTLPNPKHLGIASTRPVAKEEFDRATWPEPETRGLNMSKQSPSHEKQVAQTRPLAVFARAAEPRPAIPSKPGRLAAFFGRLASHFRHDEMAERAMETKVISHPAGGREGEVTVTNDQVPAASLKTQYTERVAHKERPTSIQHGPEQTRERGPSP